MSSEFGLNAAPRPRCASLEVPAREFAHQVYRAHTAPVVDRVDLVQERNGLADSQLFRSECERANVLGEAPPAKTEARA